jgi:lactate 2-monooxygenase
MRRSFGPERQMEIYLRGRAGQRPLVPLVIEEVERLAREKMTPQAYDYVAGGAGSESTMRANLAAFERWRIVPRMMRDVAERDLSVDLLGAKLEVPVLLAPIGVQSIIHPDAEVGTARAAAALGIPYVHSGAATQSIEQVAEAMGTATRWFQLYWGPNDELTASMLARAERAGFGAIIVTLDTPLLGWRERDLAHAYIPFLDGEGVGNFFSDPVFRAMLAEPPEKNPRAAIELWSKSFTDLRHTWEDLARLRRHTRLPIVVKGILDANDARKALDAGMQGVIVSNHGGRQVDGAISALDALPGVVDSVAGRVPVLFDSGIRRGSDAIKALALGACAVLLGRVFAWGLGVAGEAGVHEVVTNFVADFDLTLALCGCRSVKELNRSYLTRVTWEHD